MEKRRLCFWYYIIKLVIYVSGAVVVGVFHHDMVPILKHFIGGLMFLYGVEDILFLVLLHGKRFYRQDKTYFGLIEIVLGFGVLFANLNFEAVCAIWATWSIIRESIEIKELILELKKWVPRIISLVESIAVIIFSMFLIFTPDGEHAIVHLRILTIELILAPLVPLLELLLTREADKEAKALEHTEEKSEEPKE